MGIIDTLTAGFDLVRRRLWLVLLPVALDIALWTLPKLSVEALWRSLRQYAIPAAGLSADMAARADEVRALYSQLAQVVDLSWLLSPRLALTPFFPTSVVVPSLPSAGTAGLFGWTRAVIEVQGAGQLMGVFIVLPLLGLLFGTLYLALIARHAGSVQADWGALLRRVPLYWLRLVGASLLIMVLCAILGFPVMLTLALMGLLSQGLAAGLMWIASLAFFWVLVYLAFVPQAILMGEDNILQAAVHSVSVVRANFWSTLGLLTLVFLIMMGLGFVWDRMAVSTLGVLVAIVANAFIGTGLTSAVFIFYRDRLQAMRALAQQRSQA